MSKQNEQLFFSKLKEVFIGAQVEGESGFINLMRIKSAYFDIVLQELTKEINTKTIDFPDFKEEMYDKLYSFFKTYFSESGSIYFRYTPLKSKVYEKVYSNQKDVALFWKTHMLYYVKTDKLWNNLSIDFPVDWVTYKVHFDVSKMEHKSDNQKREIIYDLKKIQGKEITFEVQYSARGRKTKPDNILREFRKKDVFIDEEKLDEVFKIFEKQNEVDYFINKDAKSFLMEQFDLWLKNYLFDDESDFSERRLRELKTLKDIAFKVIDFISQFEDELVKIWNKPKFVLNSNYIITLDRIAAKNDGMDVIDSIIKHKGFEEQKKEWEELGILKSFDKNELYRRTIDNGKQLNNEYQHLPIDTKHFDGDLKLEVLSLFENLDEELEGWLIHSENYQALKTILPKFRKRVSCIYIDPPFNLEKDADFEYQVNYKDANWLTLLENRLSISMDLLNRESSVFVRCSHHGNMYVRLLMNSLFNEENYRNEIIVRRAESSKGELNKQFGHIRSLTVNYDNIYWYSVSSDTRFTPFEKPVDKDQGEAYWHNFWKSYNRPTMRYELLGSTLDRGQWMWGEDRAKQAVKNYEKYLIEQKKTGISLEEYWRKDAESLEFVRKKGNGKYPIEYWIPPRDTVLADTNWLDIKGYANNWKFKTENSEILLKRIIQHITKKDELVLDFFMGIGTTIAVAHKLKRKWIGIDMGEHFFEHYIDSDKIQKIGVIGRIKKVFSGYASGITKELDDCNRGGFAKYFDLEQYEQVLKKSVYEKSHPLAGIDDKSIYQQYVFMKDQKLLEAVEMDYETNEVSIDLTTVYPNADIAETLSNLTGKRIKKIEKNAVVFEDGERMEYDNLDFRLIRPLIWW